MYVFLYNTIKWPYQPKHSPSQSHSCKRCVCLVAYELLIYFLCCRFQISNFVDLGYELGVVWLGLGLGLSKVLGSGKGKPMVRIRVRLWLGVRVNPTKTSNR